MTRTTSDLRIVGVTVSCDIGDKHYNNGTGRFISVSSKVPESSPGISLDDTDLVMADSIEMFFTAWQTALQTRYATGEVSGEEYKRQTAAFLVRIDKIRALYSKIKDKSTEELEAFLKKAESETK